MLEDDLTGQYNTKLSALDEHLFQLWAMENGRTRDVYDYDLRGAWKASAQQAANGHLPDTYKKPNHPTFSRESQYSGKGDVIGGEWREGPGGKWSFVPSQFNIRQYPVPRLQRYFKENEPDATLVLPRR